MPKIDAICDDHLKLGNVDRDVTDMQVDVALEVVGNVGKQILSSQPSFSLGLTQDFGLENEGRSTTVIEQLPNKITTKNVEKTPMERKRRLVKLGEKMRSPYVNRRVDPNEKLSRIEDKVADSIFISDQEKDDT